jgi:hypothetical protein
MTVGAGRSIAFMLHRSIAQVRPVTYRYENPDTCSPARHVFVLRRKSIRNVK